MWEFNIICVALNGNKEQWRTEEIWFAQFRYCLTISYGLMAKIPSYVPLRHRRWYRLRFWPLVAGRDLCSVRIRKHLVTPLVALCWIEQWQQWFLSFLVWTPCAKLGFLLYRESKHVTLCLVQLTIARQTLVQQSVCGCYQKALLPWLVTLKGTFHSVNSQQVIKMQAQCGRQP